MVLIKDFPIMYSYFCKHVIKENGRYSFTLLDWERRYVNYGDFSIPANNLNDLKNIILKCSYNGERSFNDSEFIKRLRRKEAL